MLGGLVYGLPETVDLTFLRGLALNQIAIGQNETILWLDGSVRIAIETDIVLLVGREKIEERAAVIARLMSCLGAAVENVSWERDGTLRLAFTGQTPILEIRDDSAAYESYAIHSGDQIIVV